MTRTTSASRATIILLFLLGGCATSNITVRERIPAGSPIAVVTLRDCVIADQDDCSGSGLTATSIFASALSEDGFLANPVSRPAGAKDQLTDGAAVLYARSKGVPYVLNGEVEDFYRVAPMTFRPERAAASVRLLRSSDGSVVASSQYRDRVNNLSSPDAIIEAMAKKFSASIAEGK